MCVWMTRCIYVYKFFSVADLLWWVWMIVHGAFLITNVGANVSVWNWSFCFVYYIVTVAFTFAPLKIRRSNVCHSGIQASFTVSLCVSQYRDIFTESAQIANFLLCVHMFVCECVNVRILSLLFPNFLVNHPTPHPVRDPEFTAVCIVPWAHWMALCSVAIE